MLKKQSHKNAISFSLMLLAIFSAGSVDAADINVGGTTVSAYGFIKLDVMYDSGDLKPSASNGLGNAISFNNISDENKKGSNSTNIHAYESRLALKTRTSTEKGDLLTVIEGDFYGGGGGEFRLRHAYGSWNNITAGQTWTNFNTFVASTEVLDFTGPLGRAGINRQALIKYSKNGFHVALESPSGAASGSSFEGADDNRPALILNADRKDRLPDITLRYESIEKESSYSAGAIIREVAFDSGEQKDEVLGWGGFIAGSYTFYNGLTLRGQLTGGDGIGSYITGSPAPAAYRSDEKLTSISSWGGTVGASYQIGGGSVSLAYSQVKSSWNDAERDGLSVGSRDAVRELAFLNYIWSPGDHVTYGVELAHAAHETVDGGSGDAYRVHGSVIYSF